MWVNFSLSEAECAAHREDIERGTCSDRPKPASTRRGRAGRRHGVPVNRPDHVQRPGVQLADRDFPVRAPVDNPKVCCVRTSSCGCGSRAPSRPNAHPVPQRAVQQGREGAFRLGGRQGEQGRACGRWPSATGIGDDWLITGGSRSGDQRRRGRRRAALTPGAAVKPRPLAATAVPAASTAAASAPIRVPDPPKQTVAASAYLLRNRLGHAGTERGEALRSIGNGLARYGRLRSDRHHRLRRRARATRSRRTGASAEQRAKAVRDALAADRSPRRIGSGWPPRPPPAPSATTMPGAGASRRQSRLRTLMFSRFFIERPVFAAVISIIIVLAGLVSMGVLPIQQYPTIMPVQVTVNGDLCRRRFEDGGRLGRRADRGADQRRRQHAVHDVDQLGHRAADADGVLLARHRSGHRAGSGAEPGQPRAAAAADGGEQNGV